MQSKSSCDVNSLELLLVDGCGSFCGNEVEETVLMIVDSFPELNPNKSNAAELCVAGAGWAFEAATVIAEELPFALKRKKLVNLRNTILLWGLKNLWSALLDDF